MIAVHNIKNFRMENFSSLAEWDEERQNSLFYHLKQSLRGEMYSIFFLLYEEYHFGTW